MERYYTRDKFLTLFEELKEWPAFSEYEDDYKNFDLIKRLLEKNISLDTVLTEDEIRSFCFWLVLMYCETYYFDTMGIECTPDELYQLNVCGGPIPEGFMEAWSYATDYVEQVLTEPNRIEPLNIRKIDKRLDEYDGCFLLYGREDHFREGSSGRYVTLIDKDGNEF